ncbi:MAG: peptide ABC transporter substrate-binding protein [Leptolyngbyaceae cyanobacterium SM1_3_5]|nr:peptide ABC transporter substrate-binding protein [Leptolyngbyaceae cyanobacterium SM1_3_5]
MSKNFLSTPKLSSPEIDRLIATLSNPDREAVQILVIGSDKGITNVVHSLHIHGFAEVQEWSLLLPAPIPGKLMRSLTRYVSIE